MHAYIVNLRFSGETVGCRLESKDEFFYELADTDTSADLTA